MSDKILKLSQAQTLYSDLRERIDALPTSEDIPEVSVQDVQINGTSVLENGVANVPLANFNTYGVSKMATNAVVKAGTDYTSFLTPMRTDLTVFYGLSKVAGVDLANETVTVGTYPETSKTAIRSMIGAVGNTDYATADTPGVIRAGDGEFGIRMGSRGEFLVTNCATIAEIKFGTTNYKPLIPVRQHYAVFYGLAKAAGADEKDSTLPLGTYTETAKVAIRNMLGATSSNVIAVQDTQPTDTDTKIWLPETAETPVQIPTMEDLGGYVQKTDYATSSTGGVIKIGTEAYGLSIDSNGQLMVSEASTTNIKEATGAYRPLTAPKVGTIAFYGLARASGDTTQAASSNAVGTYTDAAKTAIRTMIGAIGNTDYATNSTGGVIKINNDYGLGITEGNLYIYETADSYLKAGTNKNKAVTASKAHVATFYGLAKAAGDTTQSASSNAVGTYTDEAATAIRNMLGTIGDVQINGISLINNGIANIPVAGQDSYGVVKLNSSYGVFVDSNGYMQISTTTPATYKTGTTFYRAVMINNQHYATFYGLAKAAGDTTQASSDNAIGTYTNEAATAIRSMLGAISATDYASSSKGGTIKIDSAKGLTMNNGILQINRAVAGVKEGTSLYHPIVPATQHEAVFYGLTKAAGVDMASSSNAVGTYTSEAKSAIQQMLGIDLQSIASEVEIPLVETVSGASVTISGQPNTRYMCGEVTSISITPPASGTIDVVFTSGSTVAILTLPSTVKMPEWFDATTLDTNTIYEILITDGIYGSVMTWAT